MKAIGVPELIAPLKGEISLEEAVAQAKAATRQYIKRQRTWWRGQMKHWRIDRPPALTAPRNTRRQRVDLLRRQPRRRCPASG